MNLNLSRVIYKKKRHYYVKRGQYACRLVLYGQLQFRRVLINDLPS